MQLCIYISLNMNTAALSYWASTVYQAFTLLQYQEIGIYKMSHSNNSIVINYYYIGCLIYRIHEFQ